MTQRPGIDDIASLLRLPITSLRLVSAVGSHTYGIASASSDHDFLVVAQGVTRDDLVQRNGIDIVLKTPTSFQKALDDQSIFALQALHATPEHSLLRRQGAFRWVLRREKLIEAAFSTMARDLAHAEKRFEDDRVASTRRALHSLRVGQFAAQICSTGKIADFTSIKPVWAAMQAKGPTSWGDVMSVIREPLEDVRSELTRLRDRPSETSIRAARASRM
ncbi:MAG: hypothetical protein U0165_16215 [Polyangiaceae bacterium]